MPCVPKLLKPQRDFTQPVRPEVTRSRSLTPLQPDPRLRLLARSFYKQNRVRLAFSRPLRASAAVSDSLTTATDSTSPDSDCIGAAVSDSELARRQKISNANRGKVPWNKGVPRTEGEDIAMRPSGNLVLSESSCSI